MHTLGVKVIVFIVQSVLYFFDLLLESMNLCHVMCLKLCNFCVYMCKLLLHVYCVQETRRLMAVKLSVVSCPPVVEVLIKRPDTKYQLGFSVQNGVVRFLTLSLVLKPPP